MYKKKLLLFFVLILALASFSFAYTISSTTSSTYNNLYYTTKYAGDNIFFAVYVNNSGVTINDNCVISIDSAQNVTMFYNSTGNFSYYNQTISQPGLHNFTVYCTDIISPFTFTLLQNYTINFTSNKLPMKTVQNTYYVNASQINKTQNWTNMICNLISSNMTSYFQKPFIGNLTYTDTLNSSILIDCLPIGTLEIPISEYEPKLNISAVNPFSSLTSSSAFKLGNYDLNGDGIDDLIVLGSNGLMVYDGNEVRAAYRENRNTSPSYTNTRYNSNFEFFVTDMNWDGYGDMLIGNSTDIYLLNFTREIIVSNLNTFEFQETPLVSEPNIASFGSFDINNDFYKDIIVVNGTNTNWNYALYDGKDLSFNSSGIFNLGSGSCMRMLVFDINKDSLQDIICTDQASPSANIYVLIRNSSNEDLSQANFIPFSLGYPVLGASSSNIFFSDINSDGEWEVGVVQSSPLKINFYKINATSLYLVKEIDLSTSSLYRSTLSLDLMSEDLENILFPTKLSSSPNILSLFYNNFNSRLDYLDRSFLGGITQFDIDSNGLSDIFTEISSSGRKIALVNNTIGNYRTPDYTYSLNATFDDTASNVTFSINNINSNWRNNNYFLKLNFSNLHTVFRNDYYDSQQNLKYYMTTKSNNYTFNWNNLDEYQIQVGLNKYSQILANPLIFSRSCSLEVKNCVYLENYDCTFTNLFCNYGESALKSFSAKSIAVFNTTNNWNNVSYFNANIIFNNTLDQISSSIFTNGNITINQDKEGGKKLYSQNTFTDMHIYLSNVTATFDNNLFTNSIFILNNSNVTFIQNNTAVNINSTNSVINLSSGNISGLLINSNVNLYNGSNSSLTLDNSTVLYFQYSNVLFKDDLGSDINLSGNISFGTSTFNFVNMSSVSRNFLILNQTNGSLLNMVNYFNLDLNYVYFDPHPVFSDFNETEFIVLNKTHIPSWNYFINGTWQTDFRNYTLLQNISNLSNVHFSIGNYFNLTSLSSWNYSDKDLTSFIQKVNNSFYINDTLVNTSFNVSLGLNEVYPHMKIIPAGSILSINNEVLNAYVPAGGNYSVVHDLIFEDNIPKYSLQRTPFNISINYSNYNGSINGLSGCALALSNGIFFSSGEFGFNDITINDSQANYTLTCNFPGLDSATKTGMIFAKNIFGFENKTKLDSFDLHFVHSNITNFNSECSKCSINISDANASSNGQSCYWPLDYLNRTDIAIHIVCPNVDYTDSFNLKDARLSFDNRNEMAGFYLLLSQIDLNNFWPSLIFNKNSFGLNKRLNGSIKYYSNNGTSGNTSWTDSDLFYYEGDIMGTGNSLKIIN